MQKYRQKKNKGAHKKMPDSLYYMGVSKRPG